MDWYSEENLSAVWQEIKSTRGQDGDKSAPVGVDGVSTSVFDANLNANIREISRMLSQPVECSKLATRYRFAPLRRKIISRDPGVIREICIPRIRDQIVLRAITNFLKQYLARSGFGVLGTSPRQTVKRVIAAREEGRLYVLRSDITRYYRSIPHGQLINTVASLKVDERILRLISNLLTTPLRNPVEGRRSDIYPKTGIPTGASISTLLGELFLMDLASHFDDDESRQLIRYMDDLLLVAKDEETLDRSTQDLYSIIDSKGLSLSQSKTKTTSFSEGFEFLGFQFKSRQLIISKKKSARWIRAYRGIARRYLENCHAAEGELESDHLRLMVVTINRAISGVSVFQIPYYSMADDLEPFKQLDRQIRQLVGGIFRRQDLKMNGKFRIESAYSWAWKYKRDYDKAALFSKKQFGENPKCN